MASTFLNLSTVHSFFTDWTGKLSRLSSTSLLLQHMWDSMSTGARSAAQGCVSWCSTTLTTASSTPLEKAMRLWSGSPILHSNFCSMLRVWGGGGVGWRAVKCIIDQTICIFFFLHMHHTMFFQVNLGEALFLEAIQNLNQKWLEALC